MSLEYIAKAIFIVFVVCLFVYILMFNKTNSSTKPIEHFADKEQSTANKEKPKPLAQRIKTTYLDLFSMPPAKDEVDFYVRFFKNKNEPSDQYLQEVISISAPTLKKTLKVGQPITKNDLANGTEDEVYVIFNEILNRNPTQDELEFYGDMIKKNPGQVEKMKVLLLQSQEYRMLQKMQTNKTHALTLRGVTDRQVTFTVERIYKSIAKSDEEVDEETLVFLKKKYIEFNLDDELLKKFIKSMLSFKATSPQNHKISDDSKVTLKGRSESLNERQRANDKVTKSLEKEAYEKTGSSKSADTSKMMCDIQQKAKAQFPRNSETTLSNEINNRNRDELRQICERNKRFSQFTDKDMVLLKDQSWTVPQNHAPVCIGGDAKFNPLMTQSSLLGTLLDEVK